MQRHGRIERASDPSLFVLYEGPELLAVNKPPGLVCHPTRGDENSSLIGRIRRHLGGTEGRFVNRLDRETSGVVLVAKGATVAGELGKLFGTRAIRKTYLAVVHGHVVTALFTVDAPTGRDESSAVAIKDCVRPDGAMARTDVRVLEHFHRGDLPYSLLELRPHTGRKHQLRIHLAHIGHPIVGDKLYGGDEMRYLRFVSRCMTAADVAALMVTNHALHARALSFQWRGRAWSFEADPSDEMQSWL